MLLDGYRQAIGTLWPINDAAALRTAVTFYRRLTAGGTRPADTRTAATCLAQTLRELRKTYPQTPSRWAIERGTPPAQAHLMERLNEGFRAGPSGFVTDDVENITGTAPGTFHAWCGPNADAFR